MTTTKRKPATRERWRLYQTLTGITTIDQSPTPYADAYRKALASLTDEMLCLSTYQTKRGIKIRAQETTIDQDDGSRAASIKLFLYVKD